MHKKMNVRLETRFFLFIILTIAFSNAYTRRSETKKPPTNPVKVKGNIGATWINGIIPYFLNTRHYDHVIAMRVRMIMNMLEGVSCIRFKPIIGLPESNTTWLHIANPNKERECMHEPLYEKGGKVNLVIGLECLSEQQVLHTLMHGIGFKDEVAHPQRDQFIRVLWNNIQPAYQRYFRIQPDEGVLAEYDPMSVMQFHDRAFSLNGHATIAPLIPGLIINPSSSLSQLDAMKLRMLFGQECKKRNVDDLLDMCKAVFHQNQKLSNSPDPSESGNNEKNKQESGENNRNIEEKENDNDNTDNNKNASVNEEVNNDDGDQDDGTNLNIIVQT